MHADITKFARRQVAGVIGAVIFGTAGVAGGVALSMGPVSTAPAAMAAAAAQTLSIATEAAPVTPALVVTKAGSVVSGGSYRKPIRVSANNITLEHLSVTTGGDYAVEIDAGVTGTVISNATITCQPGTVAFGPGAYKASKVKLVGCATAVAQPAVAGTSATPVAQAAAQAAAVSPALVVTKAGSVVSGGSYRKPIRVSANNITLEHLSVTTGGDYAVEIDAGVTGTVISNATITCQPGTVAFGPGAYKASKVKLVGCATAVAQPAAASTSAAPVVHAAPPAQVVSVPSAPVVSTPAPPAASTPAAPVASSPAPPAASTPAAPVASTPASPTTSAGFNYVPLKANMTLSQLTKPSARAGASNTGVPAGTVLQSSGALTVTKDGTVIDGLNITGCVAIKADNVTIENSKIDCGTDSQVIRVYSGFTNLLVEDSDISSHDDAAGCIGYGNFTALRDNIHNCVDGIDANGNAAVEYNYVHDLSRGDATHNDTFQTLGGAHMLLVGNTFQAYRADTDDLMNSAIQTGHLNNPLSDVLVAYNYFDGGNYTVNAGSKSSDGYAISGYVFCANTFGRDFRYGPVSELGSGITFDSSNVWADSGTPVH